MPAIFAPNPAWTPQNPNLSLPKERAWLIGAILTGVGYGVVVTLTIMCLEPLVKRSRDVRSMVSLVYITLIFICATLFIAGNSIMSEYSFIDYRDYPGEPGSGLSGPAAFENDMFSIPISEIGNVSFVVSNWLADAVVVWRCLVVYKGCSFPFWVVCLIPCLSYAIAWSFGLLWLIQVSQALSSPWYATTHMNFTLPYFWSSFALNVTMTIAIVGRLLSFRYNIAKVLGKRHVKHYTSVVAMIVESAVLYTGFQLVFIVLFALDNPVQPLFLQPLSQVQCIAPLLIMFRVTRGQAWTSKTGNGGGFRTNLTSQQFTNELHTNTKRSSSGRFLSTISELSSVGVAPTPSFVRRNEDVDEYNK